MNRLGNEWELLDNEYLEDYEKKEKDLYRKFFRDLAAGRIDEQTHYPPLSRFPKVNFPIARAHPEFSSVYPIIPFFGTTIIHIEPAPKSLFQERHGFKPDELNKLVDFAKDTGKVQFVLSLSRQIKGEMPLK